MKAVGLEEVETYVLSHHNSITQYIATHPILELCLSVEQQTGAQVSMIWWDHIGLELGQVETVTDME